MIERIEGPPKLPPRSSNAHKGTFGKVLLIGGSVGMSGAISLAGLGALRGGAGLVFLGVPESIVGMVAAHEPSYLTIPLPEDSSGRLTSASRDELMNRLPTFDAVAIGPGIGQSEQLKELVLWLYSSLDVPLVLDADALNLLSDAKTWPEAGGDRILTPHPGEFARLTDTKISSVQADRETHALRFASERDVMLVLKGEGSVITDGRQLAINSTGNPGMATGGSGDVLTGLTTSLVADSRWSLFEAVRTAVHVHGLAGDLAAETLHEESLIASDLPEYLSQAWRTLADSSHRPNG